MSDNKKPRHKDGRNGKDKKRKKKKSKSSSTTSTTSNWAALAQRQKTTSNQEGSKKRRRPQGTGSNSTSKNNNKYKDRRSGAQRRKGIPAPTESTSSSTTTDHHLYIACDCEMVGCGPQDKSELARVSLTNWTGRTIYDKFVKPIGKVTNYRTWVSGIRKRDLIDAMPFNRARKEVRDLLRGKILVGHALENDLKSLDLEHPDEMIRDTARYPPLLKRNAATGKRQPRKLKDLSAKIGSVIQTGSHSSVEDAVASMNVYKHYKEGWDEWLATGALIATIKFANKTGTSSHNGTKRKVREDPFMSKSKRRRLAAEKETAAAEKAVQNE